MSESESWACHVCQNTNAAYQTRCGECGTTKGATEVTEKFRLVIDLDVPVGHWGITTQAVADFWASLMELHTKLMVENRMLLNRDALRFHGVRAVTPPRAAEEPDPAEPTGGTETSPPSSPSVRPVPSSPASD